MVVIRVSPLLESWGLRVKFQHIHFVPHVYWVMVEWVNWSDSGLCSSFGCSSELGCLFLQDFERKFPFLYSFFMRCVIALSLYMPLSPCVLADMLKDMDYACSYMSQVCFFRVGSTCIFVSLFFFYHLVWGFQGVISQDDISIWPLCHGLWNFQVAWLW